MRTPACLTSLGLLTGFTSRAAIRTGFPECASGMTVGDQTKLKLRFALRNTPMAAESSL